MARPLGQRLSALRDDRLPALPDLLGDGVLALLDAALEPEGERPRDARPVQVSWSPGTSLTVCYRVRLRPSNAGAERVATMVATTGGVLPAGARILRRDNAEVAVWRLPRDPALPGLAAVLDPERARDLARDHGAPDVEPRLRLAAYRPGRRAVVELRAGSLRLFVKLVPPARAAALQQRHRIIAERLPVPRSYGWSAPLGLVVLEALPGVTLRAALGGRDDLPSPLALATLLDRIPEPGDGQRAPSPLTAAPRHALLLARLLPAYATRIAALVVSCADETVPGPLRPVHGDLHEAQIMVADGAIVGVLDIDTVGSGYRIDDLANLLGHLVVWEAYAARPRRVRAWARNVLALADCQAHPAAVRRRVAAAILGLATGPFRAQEQTWPHETVRRLELAEQWAASAARYMNDSSPRVHAAITHRGQAEDREPTIPCPTTAIAEGPGETLRR